MNSDSQQQQQPSDTNSSFTLSDDQRYILTIYMNMYEDTMREIYLNHEHLDQILNNIHNIINPTTETTQTNNMYSSLLNSLSRPQDRRQRRRTNTSSTRPLYRPELYDITFTIPDTTSTLDNSLFNIIRSYLQQPSNVSVSIPTPIQIENATRQSIFSEIQNPIGNSVCPISLERFQPNQSVTQIIYCGHIFDTNQLQSWFRSNSRCPVCRYDIQTNNPPY